MIFWNKAFSLPLFFLLLLASWLGLTSCNSSNSFQHVAPPDASQAKLEDLRLLYLYSFNGKKAEYLRPFFLEALENLGVFDITETEPDEKEETAGIIISIDDYFIDEKKEIYSDVDLIGNLPVPAFKHKRELIRRNAQIVGTIIIKQSVYGAEIFRKKFIQAYQQIYVDEETKENRPIPAVEMERLSKLAMTRVAQLLDYRSQNIVIPLEKGEKNYWGLFSVSNPRIIKGINYARDNKLDDAMLLWKTVLFEEEPNEDASDQAKELYKKNRVAAYYNIGQIYRAQEKWLDAAIMFSKANRLRQKIRYAQAWADCLTNWKFELLEKSKKRERLQKGHVFLEEKKIEQIDELLLKRTKLWPFESFQEDQPLKTKTRNETERTNVNRKSDDVQHTEKKKQNSVVEPNPKQSNEPILIEPLDLGE